MIFKQVFDEKSSTYTYILASAKGREALIIDPVIENVKSYINILKELMYENTLVGTAKKARLVGFKIGGKTGTGEKPKDGKYDKETDRFVMFNSPILIPLEEVPYYEKYNTNFVFHLLLHN